MPTPPRPIESLDTPAAVVDLDRLDANLRRTAAYAAAHGLALRPHVKTHKSVRVADQQLRLGARGLTCATPREAEVMAAVADDLLLAYPPVGAGRAARIAALPARVKLTVALDSVRALTDVGLAARAAQRPIHAYVELDVGMHRVGLPSVDDAVRLATRIGEEEGVEFAGIAFYPGHVRQATGEQDGTLATMRETLGEAIDRFVRAGLAPRVVSGGSTPTLWRTHEITGVTELRPGTYVYNDRTTAAIGACALEDCAVTVAATVISTAVPGQAVIDAGTKSLGREPMPEGMGDGFGALLSHPEVVVSRMSEEHGILDLSRTTWRPMVGEVVRVIPNHVCIVVHLNDLMYGARDGVVETTWPVDARGRGERP